MSVQMGKVQRMAWRIYFKVAPYMPSAKPATLTDRVLNRILGTGNVLDREDALRLDAALRKRTEEMPLPHGDVPHRAIRWASVLDADQAPLAPQHLIVPGEGGLANDGVLIGGSAGGGLDRVHHSIFDAPKSTRWYVTRFKPALGAAMVTGPNTPTGYATKQGGMDAALAGMPEGWRFPIMDADQAPLAPQHLIDPGLRSLFDAARSTPRFVNRFKPALGAAMVAGPNTSSEPEERFRISPREPGNRSAAQTQRREWLNVVTWYLRSPIALVRELVADARNLFRRSS